LRNSSQVSRAFNVAPHIELIHHEDSLQQSKLRRTEAFLINHRLSSFEKVFIVLLVNVLVQGDPVDRSYSGIYVEAVAESHLQVILVRQVAECVPDPVYLFLRVRIL